MTQLALVVGLMFITVMAVGAGERLKLPFPVLMLIVAMLAAFIPGVPHLDISPELILPLFLPPLLFAAAKKTSWSVFRIRWRSIVLLAVGLVVVTIGFVAGTAWLLIPGIGVPAALALGAMVAPPDPVAVESVAGKVHMPRRLLTVLQSEGLFNDAAAIVIFQAAVSAAVGGGEVDGWVALQFVLGAALAIILGFVIGWLMKAVTRYVNSATARSSVTLVAPFAVYIAAEELHASGVVAVVVTALEMRRNARPQDAAERITGAAFWDVVELLATGLAFGLIGLEMRTVVAESGARIWGMLGIAVGVCVVVIVVRVLWLMLLIPGNRRRADGSPPNSATDVVILSWCGMRGLATLALALALPATLGDGSPFPARDQIIVTACTVLVFTLILPGLSLPSLMRGLRAAESPAAEREAERELGQRAQEAAMAALRASSVVLDLPKEPIESLKRRFARLRDDLTEDTPEAAARQQLRRGTRDAFVAVHTIALDAARQEVLEARNEPGTDPEVADRVLRRLDLRTVLLDQ